jgi:hypothetical protein
LSEEVLALRERALRVQPATVGQQSQLFWATPNPPPSRAPSGATSAQPIIVEDDQSSSSPASAADAPAGGAPDRVDVRHAVAGYDRAAQHMHAGESAGCMCVHMWRVRVHVCVPVLSVGLRYSVCACSSLCFVGRRRGGTCCACSRCRCRCLTLGRILTHGSGLRLCLCRRCTCSCT